jgi:hypothetical protein
VGDAEDVEILDRGERPIAVNRVRHRGVVIAGQQHHGQRRCRNDCGRSIEQRSRHAMAIEGIAGEHNDVGADAARSAQHAGQSGRAVTAMQPRSIVMIHVQVGAMDHHDVAGRRHGARR